MEQKELNKMDLFIIKGILTSEKRKEQAELEKLKQQEQTTETIKKQLYFNWELEQITNILNKLKEF
jgi:hypothetical protein